jgi:hypothetical protein
MGLASQRLSGVHYMRLCANVRSHKEISMLRQATRPVLSARRKLALAMTLVHDARRLEDIAGLEDYLRKCWHRSVKGINRHSRKGVIPADDRALAHIFYSTTVPKFQALIAEYEARQNQSTVDG